MTLKFRDNSNQKKFSARTTEIIIDQFSEVQKVKDAFKLGINAISFPLENCNLWFSSESEIQELEKLLDSRTPMKLSISISESKDGKNFVNLRRAESPSQYLCPVCSHNLIENNYGWFYCDNCMCIVKGFIRSEGFKIYGVYAT